MGRTFRHRHRQTKNENAASLNSDPNIVNLLKTLKSNNWSNETLLELRDFSLTGRGVCSKIKIQADAILIKVPITSMITLATFSQETVSFLNKNQRINLTMQTLMSLFLCIEKHKCNKTPGSPWRFYLDSLPSCNPLTWLQLTSSEIKQFPPHVALQMQKFRAEFARSWESAVYAINPTLKCHCCNENYVNRVINVDLFAWCYAMINTRGVYIDPTYIHRHALKNILAIITNEPNLALCPFLDMFNHSTEANTTPEIFHEKESDFYVLRSYKCYRKYEQIFISYGSHDNVKLFVEYGFYIPGNLFDAWPISFNEISTAVNFDAKKYKFILSKGFDKDLYVTRTYEMSFNLKACLFIALNDFRHFNRIYSDDYKPAEINWFKSIVGRLMEVQLTLLTPKNFHDAVTHSFYEHLINFPIDIVNKLRLRSELSIGHVEH